MELLQSVDGMEKCADQWAVLCTVQCLESLYVARREGPSRLHFFFFLAGYVPCFGCKECTRKLFFFQFQLSHDPPAPPPFFVLD